MLIFMLKISKLLFVRFKNNDFFLLLIKLENLVLFVICYNFCLMFSFFIKFEIIVYFYLCV